MKKPLYSPKNSSKNPNGKFLNEKNKKSIYFLKMGISPKLQSKIAPIPSKRDWGYWKGDGKGMERGWKGEAIYFNNFSTAHNFSS